MYEDILAMAGVLGWEAVIWTERPHSPARWVKHDPRAKSLGLGGSQGLWEWATQAAPPELLERARQELVLRLEESE